MLRKPSVVVSHKLLSPQLSDLGVVYDQIRSSCWKNFEVGNSLRGLMPPTGISDGFAIQNA